MSKIITVNKFLKQQVDYKRLNKRIVLMSGSFDLYHPGHVDILRKAKRYGDILVILLNSDSSIRKYKGRNRPIFNQKERAKILESNQHIDHIIIFPEINPKKYFSLIKPEVFCNGLDWSKDFIGREILEQNRCKLVFFKRAALSASNIIERIIRISSIREKNGLIFDEPLFNRLASDTEVSQKLKVLSKEKEIYIISQDNKIFCLGSNKQIRKKNIVDTLLFMAKSNDFVLNHSYLISSRSDLIESAKEVNVHPMFFDMQNPDFKKSFLAFINKIMV